ncbi:fimbrial protein [Pseudomonas sp. FEN]|uniref:fimbrial protein n=1 Tax=Pseudomonas sp. FEN TaxID=2767468 RepID=UPI001CD22315|nr:fimbrial protein [Pseudomonas sp. FEN]
MKTSATKTLSVFFMLLLSEAATAACTRIYSSLDVSMGTVTIEDNVAIGSPLTQGWSYVTPSATWSCTANSHYAPYIQGAGGALSSYVEGGQTHSIYPTGLSGIGIAFSAEPGRARGVQQGVEKALSSTISTAARHGYAITYKLIKTGPLSSGGNISRRQVADTWMISRGSEQFPIYINGTVNVRRPTCDLAAGDVNRAITLNTVRVSDFNNANSAGARDFELTATCSMASSVTFAFSGTPAPGSSYRFANTGTASGIGLQLYSRIGGVAQTIRADGTDSRRTVAVSGNRAVLPLGASYWKIGTVSKGTLASTATVSITYN